MARYRRRSSRGHRSSERKIEHRQWFTNSGIESQNWTLKAGADTDNVIKLIQDPLKGDDCTILRTRGFILPVFSAADVEIVGALGAMVLPNKVAENASTSDLPNPLVDADSTDWFVWQPFSIPQDIGQGGADPGDETAAALASSIMLEIDSKGKRIMEASESAVWILGLNAESAVTTKNIKFSYVIRTLVGF